MSEKKPKQNGEIDAFVKALLNKKTEMALNKDSQPEREDVSPAMTPVERQSAEKTMSSALDLLRKERGQLTIEEEEEKYRREQKEDGTHIEEVEDFTTDSIHQDARVDEQMIQSIYSSIELDDPKKAEKETPKRKPLKKVRSARPKRRKRSKRKKRKRRRTRRKTKRKKRRKRKSQRNRKRSNRRFFAKTSNGSWPASRCLRCCWERIRTKSSFTIRPTSRPRRKSRRIKSLWNTPTSGTCFRMRKRWS